MTADQAGEIPVQPPIAPQANRLCPLLRPLALKAIVSLAMLAGMLLSRNLWYPNRAYPLAPVWDGLPAIPSWLGHAWFCVLLGLLSAAAVLPQPRLVLWLFVVLAALLAMWDQTRWQPWVYQYLFMLLALSFFPWSSPEGSERRQNSVLNSCRIVIAGTYLWSGVQKCNFSFATTVFPWLIEPMVPPAARPFAQNGALLIPVAETAMGIGLLWPRFRTISILLVVGMHTAVLCCLGPFGHNWNSVVWPWNVALVLITIVLFGKTSDVGVLAIVWPGRCPLHWLALLLFGVMPAFNFNERWDAYLSASLYSGNTIDARVAVTQEGYLSLPPEIRRWMVETTSGRFELDSFNWAMDELNVPEYPAERVYRKIAASIAARINPADLELVIQHQPHWLTGKREITVIRGDQLGK
jgi:hypothetical protein